MGSKFLLLGLDSRFRLSVGADICGARPSTRHCLHVPSAGTEFTRTQSAKSGHCTDPN